ncbi:MAG TPA: hypothetical protein VFS32_14100 [Candidatus Limnocylindrales bacterium]|nr:hypothetical protein [Candidatus Limnocylindrales bacterium]
MLNRPTWHGLEPATRGDRSMAVLQYVVAGVALAVALALTIAH